MADLPSRHPICFSTFPAGSGKFVSCLAFLLLAAYLLVLPISHTIAVRNLAFFLLCGITFWCAWRHRLRLHFPLMTPWLLYGAIAFFSLFHAVSPFWSLGEIKKEIGYGILTLMLTASWVRNIESLEKLILVVIVSNILTITAILHKITAIDPFWQAPFWRVIDGLLLNTGDGKSLYNGVGNLSTYLITTLPFIVAYTFQRLHARHWSGSSLIFLLALNLLALLLTGNRMGLITAIVEIIFASTFIAMQQRGYRIFKTIFIAAVSIILISYLLNSVLSIRSTSSDIRWDIWSWSINDILLHPFHGMGFGRTVMTVANSDFPKEFRLEHAHNMILNKGIQMGIPGMLAFLMLYCSSLFFLWPRRTLHASGSLWVYALAASTMSVGVFMKNMTDDFFVSHNAFLYWTLVGMVLGVLETNRKKATEKNER